MPVVAENTPKRRGRPWGWHSLALLPVLLAAFVIVTSIKPLHIECGGVVAVIGGDFQAEELGWHAVDGPLLPGWEFVVDGVSTPS